MNLVVGLRVFALLTWLVSLLLFIFKPRSAILFALGMQTLLFNVRFQRVSLFEMPVYQIGDINILYGDGLIAMFVLFYTFTQLKSFLTTFPRLLITITPFTVLFFWNGLQVVRGIILNNTVSSIRQAQFYFIPMLYYFVLPALLKDKVLVKRFLFAAITIALCTVVFNLLYFYLLGGMNVAQLGGDWRARFRFIGSYQTMLAGIGFNIILFFLLSSQLKGKLKFYMVLALFAMAAFIPQFRSIWLAVAVGALLIVIKTKKFFKIGMYATLLLLVVLGMIPLVANLAGEEFNAVFARSTENITLDKGVQEDATWRFRLAVWEEYWVAIQQHFILGQGLGSHIYITNAANEQIATQMHNDYLAYLDYFGAIGLGCFGAFIGYWFMSMRRYIRWETERFCKGLGFVLQATTVMYLIFALFFRFSDWFWVFAALGNALTLIRKNEVHKAYNITA